MIGTLLTLALAAPLPVIPMTKSSLAELEDAVRSFEATAKTLQTEVQQQIAQRYGERKDHIELASEAKIRTLELEERRRRIAAIAEFETFLAKYPEHPTYTPDAIFRLAELYFERANDEYFLAMRDFEAAIKKLKPGQAEPLQPTQHYESTIALYQQLLRRFPRYRLVDGAYYLLAYCLGEQGEDDEAVQTYQLLIALHPRSRFVVEAYTRIGEYYFDANELDKALFAYQSVLAYSDSPFFDKALYKLAWTHYRLDQFGQAVARFAELVDSSDARSSEAGQRGSELRQEAIQYIAISFSEENWGGVAQAAAFFASGGGRPWEHEAFAALGDVFFDQSKYPEAIAAYELCLQKNRAARNAPRIQDKIVQAYERVRDFDGAARAREALAESYREGTAWHLANENDAEALLTARDFGERSLLGAAVFHHRQAQAHKEAQRLEDAKRAYGQAATAYGKYLERVPEAKNRYDLSFYVADCLYYSLQFEAAWTAYGRVRDDVSDDRHREPAAFSAILASERDVKWRETLGELAPQPVLKSSERLSDRPALPMAISAPRLRVIAACDAYVRRVPPSEKSAAIIYKSAEILYAHDHFAAARKRFELLIARYPHTEVARYAANLIIESYLTEHNWNAVELFTRAALANAELSGGQIDFQKELTKFKLGAMFKQAEAHEQSKSYELAADEFLRVVDENPHSAFADKAINNAAVNFERVRRFESATGLYERISRDFPTSPLADYALFRVGINSERFYDFKKAIAAYRRLVEEYPKSSHRADALYNAALALENTQQYDRAEVEYQRYAELFPTRADAPEVYFRSARAAAAGERNGAAIANLQSFIARYSKTTGQEERIVEAHLRIAELAERSGNQAIARRAYGAVLTEAKKRGTGQAFAAKAEFQLAELALWDYERIAIAGSTRAQKSAIVERAATLTKVRDAYRRVFNYKQAEWTLAALFRVGHLYETFADAIFAAPPPPEIKELGVDFVEEYRLLLEEQAVPLEDKAVDAYRRTIEEARRLGVANDWTKRTLRSLNKLRRSEFPLHKDAKFLLEPAAYPIPKLADAPPAERAPASAPASAPRGSGS